MYSELASYHDNCAARVCMGAFCEGESCKVWFLSEVDTWHACICNSTKGVDHPEDENGTAYVVTACIHNRETAVALSDRKDRGQVYACESSAIGLMNVRLRRIRGEGSPEYTLAQEQVSRWSGLC